VGKFTFIKVRALVNMKFLKVLPQQGCNIFIVTGSDWHFSFSVNFDGYIGLNCIQAWLADG